MPSAGDQAVIWVCGGDGYPPESVLTGLAEANAAVATVHIRGGRLSRRPDLIEAARQLGPVVAVDTVADIPGAAALLGRGWERTPVLALSDDVLVDALRLGNALGWAGADARLVDRIRHKFQARALLAEAGIDGPPYALIQSTADIDAALQRVGVPGVVKPVYGAGSSWVFRIDDPYDLEPLLRTSWAEMSGDDYVEHSQMAADRAFVYEGLLVGSGARALASDDPTSPLADYCSVEGIVSAGEITVLGVTDRFVPEPPFRETGAIFPSCRPPVEQAPAIELAHRVVHAAGMHSGAFHIEMTFTAAGPVVIECNPRPGGPIPLMWERLTGRNFVTAYLRALHGDPSLFSRPLAGACGYHNLYPPGDQPGLVSRVEGLDQVNELPGVERVAQCLAPGDLADPHQGDYSTVVRVVSWATTPVGIASTDNRLRECLEVDTTPFASRAYEAGVPVLAEAR